jgi:hypothetical protein
MALGLCRLFLDAPYKYRAIEVWRIPRPAISTAGAVNITNVKSITNDLFTCFPFGNVSTKKNKPEISIMILRGDIQI